MSDEIKDVIEEFCFTDKIKPEVVHKILLDKRHLELINKRLINKIRELYQFKEKNKHYEIP